MNELLLNMQEYVMMHPTYREINSQEYYVKAFEGDKKMQDFCHVNFKLCFIEMKSFYMLKTLDGYPEYQLENLLDYTDFDTYLPLF